MLLINYYYNDIQSKADLHSVVGQWVGIHQHWISLELQDLSNYAGLDFFPGSCCKVWDESFDR